MLRFDRFMDYALHDPDHGYYAKNIQSVGSSGDFSTSASLSDHLAKAISQWIVEESQHHQFKKIEIIEIGAGNGKLMAEVKKHLPFFTRRRCRFHIVETSKPLQTIQRKQLGTKVLWHDSPQDALKVTAGNALIYSNELVDAFPVRIFKKEECHWSELHIDPKTRSEVFKEAQTLPNSSYFKLDLEKNTRVEIHQSYQSWLDQWMQSFKKGSLLTIDYGDKAKELAKNKPRGTLRAYLKHNLVTGSAVYQSIGHQDITTDVNFTDLIEWTPSLNPHHFMPQQQFLTHCNSAKARFLRDNDGAGSAFKVLQQRTK